MTLCKLAEVIESKLQTPTPIIFIDAVNMAFNGGLTFGGARDNVNIGDIIVDWVFNTDRKAVYAYDEYINTNNNMFTLKTIYNYESAEESIDSGKMCSVALDYTGITVESVVINNG